MHRHMSIIALFVTPLALTAVRAHAQQSGTGTNDAVQTGGVPQDDGADETIEYYVVEDDNDDWPDDPVSEYQWVIDDEEDSEGYVLDDDADEVGIHTPPGLPLVEAVSVPKRTRSLGGRRVMDKTAPWQAQIYYPKIAEKAWRKQLAAGEPPWMLQHYCGGSLIAPEWIVTAAHCIDAGMMKVGYRVRLGQERIDQGGGWTYKIDRVIRHPDYKPLAGGDIALIHIVNDEKHADPPVNQVRPIPLYRGADAAPPQLVTAFGWGRTNNADGVANAIMLQVNLNILDRPTCSQSRVALIDQRVVCASAPGRKTCSNDSGGSLINISKQLVGIVSAGGRSCADDGVPGVYTRVAAYLPWITKETGGAVR